MGEPSTPYFIGIWGCVMEEGWGWLETISHRACHVPFSLYWLSFFFILYSFSFLPFSYFILPLSLPYLSPAYFLSSHLSGFEILNPEVLFRIKKVKDLYIDIADADRTVNNSGERRSATETVSEVVPVSQIHH